MTKKTHPRLKELKFVLYKFCRNPSAITGSFIVLFFVFIAAAAPYLAPPGNADNPYIMPHKGYSATPKPPSATNILGTTSGQYDIYYGIVWGTRTVFRVVSFVLILTVLLGIIVGTVAGYFGGIIDEILMRITDIFLTIPPLVLAMAIVVAFGRGLNKIMWAMVVVGWPGFARIIRSSILTLRELDYVQAAKVMGVSDLKIMLRHIIPNAIYPLMIVAFLRIGDIVIATSFYAFMGLGESFDYADWGQMTSMARNYIIGPPDDPLRFWYTILFPGLALVMFTLGWNLIGDAIRDVFDPRMRRR